MNQLIMILLISVLVLVHEFGHFVAAKMFGVRVTRFGIGMPIGPSWKLFKWGNTNFYIHAFLFGGYVSFADDEKKFKEMENESKDKKEKDKKEFEEYKKEAEENGEILPSDSKELYENKDIWQKLVIVSAGVFMNIVFAIILVMFAAAYYHKLPTSNQNIYVGSFSKKVTSTIEKKGIKENDRFLKINGEKINSLYQLTFFAKNSKLFDGYAQEDLIEKNTNKLKKLNPSIKDVIPSGKTIILPKAMAENPLKINRDILQGLEKYKKDGIELDKNQIDLRDKLYGKKRYTFKEEANLKDVAYALSDTYKPVSITVLRNDKELTFNDIKVDREGMLGVMLKIEEIYLATNTPKSIVVGSCDYLYTTTKTMLYSLWQLVTGKVSATDMHGVIAIVKVGGDIIASKGMLNGMLLTAMISINLAIMNFLPIPALDGGHVMFLLIEKLTGKKPSNELSEKINEFFFILLIVLMISICYNDIFALVTKKF